MKSDLVFLTLLAVALLGLFVWSSRRVGPLAERSFEHFSQRPKSSQKGADDKRLLLAASSTPSWRLQAALKPKSNNSTRILCWVLSVDDAEHRRKSKATVDTWGRRCDKLLVVRNGTEIKLSQAPNAVESVLTLPVKSESHDLLWFKVRAAFTFIHSKYLHQFDWFLKTDDDTYVLVDNLRDFLAQHSADERVWFGYKFRHLVKQGYMSGGSGYVLSRAALNLLVEQGFKRRKKDCKIEHEDVCMGLLLEALGVKAGDSRDPKGRPRFLPLNPEWLLTNNAKKAFWFYQYWFYGPPGGPGPSCCSDKPVSFHYVKPEEMYLIDWLLYQVKRANNNNSLATISEAAAAIEQSSSVKAGTL